MVSSAGSAAGDELKEIPPRVLVCDDSPTDCAIIKSLLQRRHLDVTVANSGEKALELLASESFDLLLLDVQMEGLSGIDVTEQLRRSSSSSGRIPIILLTAQTSREDRLVGLKAGATDFITKPFDPAELTVRIENHVYTKRLHDRLAFTNKELNEERAKVSKVQRDLLPKKMPEISGLSFGSFYLPSGMASGDYFDVIERGGDSILLAIGDVSGHGIPSAMHMSVLRAILRCKAVEGASVSAIVSELNHVLCQALDSFSFVTFYLAEYNWVTREIIQTSAGHHPPLLVNAMESQAAEIPVDPSLPLGIDADIEFRTTEFTVAPGDRIVLYTDGVPDQTSPSGEFFGPERLTQILRRPSLETPESVCRTLEQELIKFSGRNAGNLVQQDDATMLVMQVEP